MNRLCLALAVLAVMGCEEEFKPPPPKKAEPTEKSNIVKVETAVPYGKTVACEEIFPSVDRVGTYVSDLVDIKDRTASNKEATAVCSFMRSGEPPKSAGEAKAEKKNQVLGVLPGDEYCTITLYCSLPQTEERLKEQCEAKGDKGNRDLGQYSCVHETQRAHKYAYTYKTIEPRTRCVVEVMGGPSVTDEPLVQNCTKAALEILEPANLRNYR